MKQWLLYQPWYQCCCIGTNVRGRVYRIYWFHFEILCVINPQIWRFLFLVFLLCRAIRLYDLFVGWRFPVIYIKGQGNVEQYFRLGKG